MCYCDKFHRDEDMCNANEFCQGMGLQEDFFTIFTTKTAFLKKSSVRGRFQLSILDLLYMFPSCRLFSCNVYSNVLLSRRPRYCTAKTRSLDLPNQGTCFCDRHHVRKWENKQNCNFVPLHLQGLIPVPTAGEDDLFRRRLLVGTDPPRTDPPAAEATAVGVSFEEDWAIAFHYSGKDPASFIDQKWVAFCDDNDDFEQEFEDFDPNCAEGGYAGYGRMAMSPYNIRAPTGQMMANRGFNSGFSGGVYTGGLGFGGWNVGSNNRGYTSIWG